MKQFHTELKNISTRIPYSEQLDLFKEYKETQSLLKRDKIFKANLGLVFFISKKFNSTNIEDAEQFGFIGLVKAIENFNPDKNIRFSTYAIKCITNEIQTGLKLVNNIVSVPASEAKKEDYQAPTYSSPEDFELEADPNTDFDRELFWIIVQQICTQDETDLLLKRYCYEEKMTLAKIGTSWNLSPEQLGDVSKQLVWKKLNRILKKLRSNEILKKYYA
ncbi:sigma-70 family RNA polymerase sigma factor [Flavobacterium panici]|uniref:Sigma-70 family RNA polymerase sigma factor n=1 Tax=Flavobacterium panici TaxID=2654843 RepID=A0A9N8IYN7_9FLAO|nr:sigma-70 family RNA polymerase sigma factor [Flavobacterium panici]CAC9972925.1 sigma-70 family RNA polymerase sigma factor [Flavobacterium panici]